MAQLLPTRQLLGPLTRKRLVGDSFLQIQVRFKGRPQKAFSVKSPKHLGSELALAHYDNFYSKVYGKYWQSIRLGLLSPNKYGAIINHFASSEETQIALRQNGAYNLQYIYEKNMKRILKYLEKKKFIDSRRVAMLEENPELQDDQPEILNSNVTSDSEFENIGAFFTQSEGDTGGTFINAAQMELNLNDYIPVSQLNYQEESVDDREYFQFYDMSGDLAVTFQDQNVLSYPTMLNLFTYPRNDFSIFEPPSIKAGLFDYYLIDLASVLPVLVLGIEDGDEVADFCAAPGGKSLMLYLTLKNCRFFFNDLSLARLSRLQNVFSSFIPKSSQANIEFSNRDAVKLKKPNGFNKILVDAPCTNDRHSLYVDDNNIFARKRIKERVALPNTQLNLLVSALDSLRVGGSVVYSTCSLSPIQNDGVVHMALKQVWGNSNRAYSVVNLKEALRPLRGMFRFNNQFKYGVQVLPFVCSNFGPMYFSKITRTK